MSTALIPKIPEVVVLYDERLTSFKDIAELELAVDQLKTIVLRFEEEFPFMRYTAEWPPERILLAMHRADLPVNKLYRLIREVFSGCGYSICGICEMEIHHHEPDRFTQLKVPSTYRVNQLH